VRQGVIIKAYGGFYYIKDEGKLFVCALRGRFRKKLSSILVGDAVEYEVTGEESGVIENILPRRTALTRPPVANVDKVIIVLAVREPEPNPALLDRILIQAQAARVAPFICFNKADLDNGNASELISVYRKAGYEVLITSVKNRTGLEKLKDILRTGTNVLAGSSGVGKSSLLNAIEPELSLKMSQVSSKIGRGRHTTRHVELLSLAGGGLVLDTPGFSSLILPPLTRTELSGFFPEFQNYEQDCRFAECLHYKEPDCSVKRAVQSSDISQLRYDNYIKFLLEIIEQEKRRYD